MALASAERRCVSIAGRVKRSGQVPQSSRVVSTQLREIRGMTGYPCTHFSLANPIDDGANDLPRLLRRLADKIEELPIKPIDILDLTVSNEMTGEGPWWSVTLYYVLDDPDAPIDRTVGAPTGDDRDPPESFAELGADLRRAGFAVVPPTE
jgi:hypothetical protein